MNLRRARSILWTAAVVMVMLATAALAWGLFWPVRAEFGLLTPAQRQPTMSRTTRGRTGPTDEERLWVMDLRRPLFDAPPPVIVQTVTQPPPLTVKLRGTILEPGRSLALLATADGKTQMRRVGDTLDGAEILSIEPGRITVRFNGQTVTLQTEKAERS